MKRVIWLVVLLLMGCATAIEAVDPWIGASVDKLKTTWGVPLKIEDDGTGGQILTYEVGIFCVDSSGTIYQTNTNYERPPTVDKWVGKNVKELIAEKGSPSHITDLGDGGQTLEYRYTETITTPGSWSSPIGPTGFYEDGRYVNMPRTRVYTQPKTIKRIIKKVFYVNKSGIIYETESTFPLSGAAK
jgi:hypothetical protein